MDVELVVVKEFDTDGVEDNAVEPIDEATDIELAVKESVADGIEDFVVKNIGNIGAIEGIFILSRRPGLEALKLIVVDDIMNIYVRKQKKISLLWSLKHFELYTIIVFSSFTNLTVASRFYSAKAEMHG